MGAQLGSTLRRLRKHAGLTLEQVATAAEVSPAALSLFETGKRNPSPKVLGVIASILNYPVEPLVAMLEDERAADRHAEARRSYEAAETASAGVVVSPSGFSRRPVEDLFEPEAIGEQASAVSVRAFGASDPRVAASHFDAAWGPSPSQSRDDESVRELRIMATQEGHGSLRLYAIERLGDQASLALRTLRGLANDEDPTTARQARRMLRELGVPAPDEAAEEEPPSGRSEPGAEG